MENPEPSTLNDLYWQDEILQVMYWLLGEGFAEEVTVVQLRRFLDGEPGVLEGNLRRLADTGLVETGPGPGSAGTAPGALAAGDRMYYRLTRIGQEEARRRFIDEFRPLIGRTGHGECSDDCWCHDPDHAGEPCPSTVHSHEQVAT